MFCVWRVCSSDDDEGGNDDDDSGALSLLEWGEGLPLEEDRPKLLGFCIAFLTTKEVDRSTEPLRLAGGVVVRLRSWLRSSDEDEF